MKKIKKLIVAVMAMAMMFGMLTVSASAAEYTDAGTMFIAGSMNGWSFAEMEGADGVYTIEYDLVGGTTYKYKYTVTGVWPGSDSEGIEVTVGGSNEGEPDIEFTPETDGTYVFTVDTSKILEGSDEYHWKGGDAISVTAKGDTGAGVSTPVVTAAVVAVIALAGAAICMKKRTVTE